MIVLGNLANITLFSAAIPGPEQYLAAHPLWVVTFVFVQIVATLALIDVLATRTVPDVSPVAVLRNGGVTSKVSREGSCREQLRGC
jgi:hypothetical protein